MPWLLSHSWVADFVPRLEVLTFFLLTVLRTYRPAVFYFHWRRPSVSFFASNGHILDPEARAAARPLRSPNAATDFASKQVRYAIKPSSFPYQPSSHLNFRCLGGQFKMIGGCKKVSALQGGKAYTISPRSSCFCLINNSLEFHVLSFCPLCLGSLLVPPRNA